jgi:hypothetical protein
MRLELSSTSGRPQRMDLHHPPHAITGPRQPRAAVLSGCCQPVAPRRRHSNLNSKFGSGTEIRTPNLAVNRSLRPAQESRPEFAECC